MHKLICSRCLQGVNVLIPSLPNRRLSCSHARPYSRWFALYEDVTPVEIPISELPPSSSSYTHEAPIGLNDPRSIVARRSTSGAYVPTLVDASELGGRDIVDDDAIASLLGVSTGNSSAYLYDLDSLLATAEESNLELPKLDVGPSRDLLPASTLRGSSPLKKAFRIPPEKERLESSSPRVQGVRSRLMSIPTVAASTAATSTIVAPMVEEKVVKVEKVEAVQPVTEILPPVPMREGEVNVQALMDVVEKSDMAGLRSLLTSSFWPKARLSPYQVSRIFTLVVDQARDCEECRDLMRDFACCSSRHCLPSHIPLLLAARAAREEGVQRALEALHFHHKAFIMAPISLGAHASLRVSAARCLWKEVARRSEEGDLSEIYESGVRMGLLEGARELMEEALKEKMRSGASFSSIFRGWKEMGERYGSRQDGMGTVVRAAMEEEGERRRDSLVSISSYVASSPSLRMESFIVHLVLNLLSRDEEKAAKHVFSLVSINGKHWRGILGELERDQCAENLVLVEKIANLITFGVIGELRKKEKKKGVEGTADGSSELKMEEEKKVEEKDEWSEMMETIVWKANGGRHDSRKKAPKKAKRRVKVDQKEVHDLTERIQKTWLHLENALNGPSSEGMGRLTTWSLLHRLAIPDSLVHLIPSTEKKNFRESGV